MCSLPIKVALRLHSLFRSAQWAGNLSTQEGVCCMEEYSDLLCPSHDKHLKDLWLIYYIFCYVHSQPSMGVPMGLSLESSHGIQQWAPALGVCVCARLIQIYLSQHSLTWWTCLITSWTLVDIWECSKIFLKPTMTKLWRLWRSLSHVAFISFPFCTRQALSVTESAHIGKQASGMEQYAISFYRFDPTWVVMQALQNMQLVSPPCPCLFTMTGMTPGCGQWYVS